VTATFKQSHNILLSTHLCKIHVSAMILLTGLTSCSFVFLSWLASSYIYVLCSGRHPIFCVPGGIHGQANHFVVTQRSLLAANT